MEILKIRKDGIVATEFVHRAGNHLGGHSAFTSFGGDEATTRNGQQKGRYSKSESLCPLCEGKGRVVTRSLGARGRKGGNVAYLKSLEPGAMSMADRGRKGGRPRALTLIDLGGREPSS